jgi:ribosomal protein L10
MERSKKVEQVAFLKSLYSSNSYVFLINISSVNVASVTTLRASLSKVAKLKVVKNTINKIACSDSNFKHISESLKDQVLTIFTSNPVEVAKGISSLSSEIELKVIGCADQKNFYNSSYVEKMSKLPSIEVIRSQILGSINGVPSKLLSTLSGVHKNTLSVLKQKYSE